jgi:predicted nuclease with TOPRIM domain
MNHNNAYQCLDSVRQHIAFLEKKALDHADKVRELEADKEMLDLRLSEVQVHYAEVEQEKEELGATIRDLRSKCQEFQSKNSDLSENRQQDGEQIANLLRQVTDLREKALRDAETIDHMCKECQGWEDRAGVLTQALEAAKDKIKLHEYWQEQRLKAKPKEAGVHTTRLYWDCNCEKDYINHSYIIKCEICGAHKADQPDSRLNELGMARLSGINELAERYARSNK